MPLSPNLQVIRVTGSYVDAIGNPATGSVTFTLSGVLIDQAANQIIMPTPVAVNLVNGAFAVDLPATDDPDLTPVGLTYAVRESVAGQSRSYNIVLPWNTAGRAIDLADVAPVGAGGTPTYTLLRLDAMADVAVAGAANGAALVYNASTGKWVAGTANAIEPYVFAVTGVLQAMTGKSRVYLEGNFAVESVRAALGVSGTTVTLVDVRRNGASIYTGVQGNRPQVPGNAFTALGGPPAPGTVFASGDYLTVDVVTPGTGASDLTVTVRLRRTS